ncbi:MAG: alpha-amylase family glycosyl hydrolase, partial [Anaerolineales bacterium]|nr:alpha-amylase family glycosyl hydrolase [Anaerolineales bacterium]
MREFASSDHEAARSLHRILPRLKDRFQQNIKNDPEGWNAFLNRLTAQFPVLFGLYIELYGSRYDFFYHIEDLLTSLTRAWFSRSDDLRKLDTLREENPDWYQSNKMVGAVCYVDLFAENIEGIRKKIPYFKELGLTYLHLMPLFETPEGENDGGYAVSDYRKVNPSLGTMKQLESLSYDLRQAGISLALDLVFNHTSDEHVWARQAILGNLDYEEFYRIFPDRNLPDIYEQNLREIFPLEHPGAFTYHPKLKKWVWTTFHSYQWDLNYENPQLFNRMADEMLFLANIGVEILRLDAV